MRVSKDREKICRYDGKMSLAELRGTYFLFARANTKAEGGGRSVQVASSASPMGPFGPFRLLRFEGYDARGPGNIYFAAVKAHPLFPRSMLLGILPVNLGVDWGNEPRSKWREGVSFIALSHSCDGVHWSRLVPIASSIGLHQRGGRTADHPVDGFVLRGGAVDIFLQLDVLQTSSATGPYRNSRIVRLRLRRARLLRLARDATLSLRGGTTFSPNASCTGAPLLAS